MNQEGKHTWTVELFKEKFIYGSNDSRIKTLFKVIKTKNKNETIRCAEIEYLKIISGYY